MSSSESTDYSSVSYEAIDIPCEHLFEIANALHDGMKQAGGATAQLLKVTIESLCDYTRIHFAAEERLMLTATYPDYRRHMQSHDALIGKIEEFESRMRNGDIHMAGEIHSFLVRKWLAHHIGFEDQQYAAYIDGQARLMGHKYLSTIEPYWWRQPRTAQVGY